MRFWNYSCRTEKTRKGGRAGHLRAERTPINTGGARGAMTHVSEGKRGGGNVWTFKGKKLSKSTRGAESTSKEKVSSLVLVERHGTLKKSLHVGEKKGTNLDRQKE